MPIQGLFPRSLFKFSLLQVSLRQGGNGPQVTWDGAPLTVPTSHSGTVFQQVGRYLTVQSPLGFMVKWDGKESIFFRVSWLRIQSIC